MATRKKIKSKVYNREGGSIGIQDITIVDNVPIAGTYGRISGGRKVVKMGSNWYL